MIFMGIKPLSGTKDGVFSSWPAKKCLAITKGQNGEWDTISSAQSHLNRHKTFKPTL